MVRKSIFAAVIVVGLAMSSSAVPATATEPAPPASYQLGDPASVEARFHYGAVRGDSIPIGVDTERVIIQPTDTEATGSLRGPVKCSIYGSHSDSIEASDDRVPLGGSVTRQWTAEEWSDPAARFLDLPEGTIAVWPNRDEDDYDRFDLYCDASLKRATRQVTRLLWRLTPYEVVTPVITLVEDPLLRFGDEVSSRYVDGGPTRTLTSGQEVRVVGPAGSWPVFGSGTGAYGNLDVSLVTDTDVLTMPSETDDDGSTVTFVIPDVTTAAGPHNGAYLSIASDEFVDGDGTRVTRRVTWEAPVSLNVTGIGQSQTTLTVPKYAVRWWRATAAVTVERATTTTSDTPWGSVRFAIDGEQFGPDVAVDQAGRASVKLPYLDRGRHVVSVWYLGDSKNASSVSSDASLRVLF